MFVGAVSADLGIFLFLGARDFGGFLHGRVCFHLLLEIVFISTGTDSKTRFGKVWHEVTFSFLLQFCNDVWD